MAEDTKVVAGTKETLGADIAQITCVKRNVGVATPIRNVKFTVAVLPDSAAENGCRVAPDTWVVPEGSKVIFTAMPADGFTFDGWHDEGGVPLSTALVAELQIDFPVNPAALALVLEARFSPV